MSNMGPFGGNKNPPWSRGAVGNPPSGMVPQGNPLQQQMLNQGAMGSMGAAGMVQYQQSQPVFQTPMSIQQPNLGMGLQQITSTSVQMNPGMNPNQLFSQVGTVTYPNPRALNPSAFQTQNVPAVSTVQNSANTSTKQRVFTGTVTKVHDNFGFVDEEVFFQTTACVKGSNPVVGDRVLVEASYNPNMPFKWNATRIQVLQMSTSIVPGVRNTNTSNNKVFNSVSSGYNAVPPPVENTNGTYLAGRNNQRSKGSLGGRSRDRSRDRDRDDDEIDRKRRREDRIRERDEKDKKSPLRRRSRSPKSRRRARIVPRYMVQIPKIALHLPEADVLEIRRRYSNLYVPSDFFCSQFRWIDAFPPNSPFALNKPCSFHIMNKDVDMIAENSAVLEPSDADYLFSAKVMLMSIPTMDELFSKCCSVGDEKDKKERESEDRDFVHPTRLINFLVGLRGKNETMAIGGPWSPSLDGENPNKDPSVLIKTAIRTCQALTGVDLSFCTQWYRFVELYYHRAETSHKGKVMPARVETVVLFLPDVWSCVPTQLEWDALHGNYKKQLERRLRADQDSDEATTADEKEEEVSAENKLEPTHYSLLDAKVMNVTALRAELRARGVNDKGLKSQLVARLTKILKAEAEKTEDDSVESTDHADSKMDIDEKDEKRKESDVKKLDEKEKGQLEKRYTLPEEQHILVHPSRVAKSGKFDCTVMSLSLLLDYRPEDTKEHSFEVSLFAELFNEMLMRDFGFNIYKALCSLPEKVKDSKEEKKKKDDEKKEDKKDKKDEKEKKSEEKKSDEKKKDVKKDEDDDDVDDAEEEEEDDKKEKEKRKSSDKDSRDRKKKDRNKLVTKDRNLLLSFVYFDQTHCGYIFEKDIEDLIYTLGLNLSRAQVRKLVSKVVTRDSLHYRKLTDKQKDEPETNVEENNDKTMNAEELALGNKKLLPIFNDKQKADVISKGNSEKSCSLSEGFVMYQGALMDVGKLLTQLKRSEKARVDTETRMIELKTENNKLLDKNDKSSSTIKHLSNDLLDCKTKLQISDESLIKIKACSKLFHSTLLEIRDTIEPVINNNLYQSSDVPNVTSSSKAEAMVKTEIKKEVNSDSRWENDNAEGEKSERTTVEKSEQDMETNE